MTRHVVIEGNLTRDPNGGYGKDTGKAYTHLDIAVTDRTRNTTGEWVDGPPTYYRVTVFGKPPKTPSTASPKATPSSPPANSPSATTPAPTAPPASPTKSSPTTSEQPSPTPESPSTPKRPTEPADRVPCGGGYLPASTGPFNSIQISAEVSQLGSTVTVAPLIQRYSW